MCYCLGFFFKLFYTILGDTKKETPSGLFMSPTERPCLTGNGRRWKGINGKVLHKTFPVLWCHVCFVQSDISALKTNTFSFCAHARLLFLLDILFSIDVFICPCVHAVFLSLSPPLPFHRASEQKHINVTAVHLNGSSPRQLDLDLYLGVYAGDARRAHIAFFFFLCTVCGCECGSHSMNRPTVAWLRPKAFKAHCMCGWGLSCTGR